MREEGSGAYLRESSEQGEVWRPSGPSWSRSAEVPAAFGSPPALAGDGGGERERRGGGGGGGEESRRCLRPPLDRLGLDVGGVVAAQVNLVPRAAWPPPLFMAQCDGGPPAIVGLGAPDQGA